MFKQLLLRIRDRIRNHQYIVTEHARQEMINDLLTVFDVEHVILTGEILERQRDQQAAEWKYRIRGSSLENDWVEIAVKITPTGKIAVLTVYTI
jgi:hypothetical protein